MANIELRRRYPRDVFGIEPYLDRLFDLDTSLWDLPVTSFPIDVIENDNEYLVRASVAGFDPEAYRCPDRLTRIRLARRLTMVF